VKPDINLAHPARTGNGRVERGSERPLRLLLLTADIGEGHNSAARAIGHTVQQAWPGSEVTTFDSLSLLGAAVESLMRSTYQATLAYAPMIYDLYYRALWRFPRFALIAKRMVAAVFGRRLAGVIEKAQPDVVICTHPFGSAGMHWLRRNRDSATPTATFITDFAAHPFWVFSGIDVNFVMHDVAVGDAEAFGGAGVSVSAPPVAGTFRPRPPNGSRAALGLREQACVILVTGGSWGVGTLLDAVITLLGLDDSLQVVAVCGRNDRLRKRLEDLGASRDRLLPLGWVDTMPDYLAAADAVVTNAGGVTALEAFASARPLVLFDPIAGHGKANAALMEKAGLATICATSGELRETIAALAGDRALFDGLRKAELEHLSARDLAQDIRRVVSLSDRWRPLLAGEAAPGRVNGSRPANGRVRAKEPERDPDRASRS
jgi:UDP-N-acetylglucosamine:LPS N-acetylglucosamine transferase